jgi:adenylate cyclase
MMASSAYSKYLEGRQAFKAFTKNGNEAAKQAFKQATELDDNFARAHGWHGYAHLQDIQDGWTDDAEASKKLARELAEQGVKLDPDDYYTHWNLASVLAGLKDVEGAAAEYEEAKKRNPDDADLLVDMSDHLSYQGGEKAAQAAAQIERAMELKIPEWYHWSLGFAFFQMHKYEQAVSALSRMKDPPNTAYLLLKACEAKIGKKTSADDIMARLKACDPIWNSRYLNQFPFARPEDEKHYLESIAALGIEVPAQDS